MPVADQHALRAIEHVASKATGSELAAGVALTMNFQPDVEIDGRPLLAVLLDDGVIRSQFETRTSNGGLTAVEGGERWLWERRLFGGAYDSAPLSCRPKYAALNCTKRTVGASPRFGSCHFRLKPHVLNSCTFVYPESSIGPVVFGTRMQFPILDAFLQNEAKLEPLDHYIEAHIHQRLDVSEDVEAIVLDPSFQGTDIERVAMRSDTRIEWHAGFSISDTRRFDFAAYRGSEVAHFMADLLPASNLTPADLTPLRQRGLDPQLIKKSWHCLARFGDPDPPEIQK